MHFSPKDKMQKEWKKYSTLGRMHLWKGKKLIVLNYWKA